MIFGLQPIHLIVIAIVALIIFGPTRLPELGRGIGKAISEFRKGTQEMTDSFHEESSKPVGYPTPAQAQAAAQAKPAEPSVDPKPGGGNYCVHCGAPNPAGAKFCNSCGEKMDSGA